MKTESVKVTLTFEDGSIAERTIPVNFIPGSGFNRETNIEGFENVDEIVKHLFSEACREHGFKLKPAVRVTPATGRPFDLHVQRDDGKGSMWATRTRANNDRGYTLYSDGQIEQQTWRGGEKIMSRRLVGAKFEVTT